MSKKYLVLEDGRSFVGEAFGAPIISTGELSVETGNFGYQEALTDQTNTGRILIFTTPLIGGSGITAIDYESITPAIKGVVVNDIAQKLIGSHSFQDLDQFLKEKNIPGIYGIDTRDLVRHFLDHNIQKASMMDTDDQHAIDQIKALVLPKNKVQQTSTSDAYAAPNVGKTVAIIDFGLKHSLLREMSLKQINTIVLPFDVSLEEILNLRPDGVIFSNGPGKLEDLKIDYSEIIKSLQSTLPIMGIGLGYLVISQYLNLPIVDLDPPYHGINYPVINDYNKEIWQTAMNIEQFVQAPTTTMKEKHPELFFELHQNYLAGFLLSREKLIGIAFNPEGSPGSLAGRRLFDRFLKMME